MFALLYHTMSYIRYQRRGTILAGTCFLYSLYACPTFGSSSMSPSSIGILTAKQIATIVPPMRGTYDQNMSPKHISTSSIMLSMNQVRVDGVSDDSVWTGVDDGRFFSNSDGSPLRSKEYIHNPDIHPRKTTHHHGRCDPHRAFHLFGGIELEPSNRGQSGQRIPQHPPRLPQPTHRHHNKVHEKRYERRETVYWAYDLSESGLG